MLRLSNKASPVRLLLLASFSTICSLALLIWVLWGLATVYRMESEGKVVTLQGPVGGFFPETATRKDESFSIGSVNFTYSRSNPQVGFSGTLRAEDHFRVGSCVRVRYFEDSSFGNRILRLELLDSAAGGACEAAPQ